MARKTIYDPLEPFTATDLHLAYARLNDEEREIIDSQIDTLNNAMSDRNPRRSVMFGKASALELLAALGRIELRLENGAVLVDGVLFDGADFQREQTFSYQHEN